MSDRISWLDGWRGAAIWLMLVYHLLFDLTVFGWMSYARLESWPLKTFERLIAWSFILCAGWSATLTRSNLRRGLITLAAGGVVTAVSFAVGAPILFGVLHLLGLSMLIYAALGRYIERIPEKTAPVLWLALFAVFLPVTELARVDARWLFWLGFTYDGYVSYDHFPIVPYIFLFFLGAWLGRTIRDHRERFPFLDRTAPRWLTWPGRRSLWIYLLHQPVLFGACFAVYALTSG